MRKLNLQMFSTETTSTLSNDVKTYYEKRLIDLAEAKLVHNQFGDKYPIPKNGGNKIEFRKYSPLAKATTALTEGTTPAGSNMTVTLVTATIAQYGDFIKLSDLLILTAIDNNIVQATKLLGSQAGRTLDSITRDVLAGGSNVIYVGNRAGRSSLTAADTLTPNVFFMAETTLEANNADTIDDSYVAIIHPYAKYDLITSTGWIDVHKYADSGVDHIYKGEIGRLGNIRFVESSEAKIWNDNTCPVKTAATEDDPAVYYSVFSTLVLGAHAYAVTEVEGGGLEHIIKQLGYGDDPLNQRASVGWKATHVAKRLVENYMVRIESVSAGYPVVPAN